MTARYVIEGDLVTREDIVRGQSVPLTEMLANLTSYQPLDLANVPKGLCALKVEPITEGDGELYMKMLIEQEPTIRTIRYKNTSASRPGPTIPYTIRLPYVWFWMGLRGSKVTTVAGERVVWSPQGWGSLWGKEPYTGWQTQAYLPAFPNMFDDTRICFGAVRQNADQSLANYVNGTINGYWTSEFNNDISSWQGPSGDGRFDTWDNDNWQSWDYWTRRSPNTIGGWLTDYNAGFSFREPMQADAGTPVPAVPIIQTFNNVEAWLDDLEPQNRARLIHAVTNYGADDDTEE